MIDDLYQEVILEEYAHPKNTGKLDSFDVHFAERHASCGDQIEVFLKFDETGASGKVVGVSWIGVGCAISMAAASVLSQELKGKNRAEIGALTQQNLENMLGIHGISIGREKCLLLALTAFQKAITT